MSAESGNKSAWHSNGSYPASDGSEAKPPESENADQPEERPDVPTVEERIDGLLERWPERCMVPVSEVHGTKLRREAVEEPEMVEETVEVGPNEEMVTYETVKQSAQPHIAVVEELLEMYERYRDLHLKLEKRERHKEPEQFLIGLDNSYSPSYQSKHYARLSAWERQILGGEYPHGEEVSGSFEEPVTVLMGLTASAYREPGNPASGLKPVCDHDREIRDAWTGSSGSVKRVLRYVLEDTLGLDSDSYTWWVQSEPHGGDGPNADRSHSHPVVVLDASAANVSADAISPETFRPVVAKHVAECDGATWDAHRVGETVEVRTDEEINSLSGYVAKYVACEPDKDLFERSDEYLMWAASQWATATQKYSRDRVATAATKADACHQEYVSEESHQSNDHGEVVVRSRKPGVSFECAACGSSFGIGQSGTLTGHRLRETATDGAVAADGGEVVEEASETVDGLSDGLRSRWRDARGAVVVGGPTVERECGHEEPDTCPLCATETEAPDHTVSGEVPIPDGATVPEPVEEESASFRRPPTWEPVSVVRVWSEEEESIGAPGGVEYEEVVVEGAGSAAQKMPDRLLAGESGDGRVVGRTVRTVDASEESHECVSEVVRLSGSLSARPGVSAPSVGRLPLASWLEGPEPWRGSPVEESDVRSGLYPPPEVLSKEHAEHYHGRRITPKQWPDDWYARRFEESVEEESEADRDGLDSRTRERIIQLVENESIASAVEVVGKLQLPPSAVEAVEVLLG